MLMDTFLINRIPSKPLSYRTPLQVLSEHFDRPYLENNLHLIVFGCVRYVHINDCSKLDPRAIKCVYLGEKDK